MSVWTGDRLRALWETAGHGLNQAHNGYLEQFVNLGHVGVGFILVIMLTGLLKLWSQMNSRPFGKHSTTVLSCDSGALQLHGSVVLRHEFDVAVSAGCLH